MNKFELIDNENIINQTCLYNTKPIVLNPQLALIFGDSDLALIFQQIHYWVGINKQNAEMGLANVNTYHRNRFWCFQTYEQWEQQFIWLDKRTIRRKIKKLEDLGVVISDNFNQLNLDRTKWYTIDYKRLLELQKDTLTKKLQELKTKIKKRTEKEKKSIQKFKENKSKNNDYKSLNNCVDNMCKHCGNNINNSKISLNFRNGQNDHFRNGQNDHFEMDNLSITIQEINKQDINYIQEINKVCLSVVEETKKEITDGQTDYTQNSNNNFKIELDNCNNEIKKTVITIANKLLQQKTTTVANKKIDINSLIQELEKMDKQTINKLIDYVVKKFELSNSDNIKNKAKYISAIFTNAILEKSYLLDDAKREISDSNYNYTQSYGTNKFVNYKQESLDNDLLRQIEQKTLREGLEDENDPYADCFTPEDFRKRREELNSLNKNNVESEDEYEFPF